MMETRVKTDSEIIAEFMGLKSRELPNGGFPVIQWYKDDPDQFFSMPEYDSSWNSLMPVVEKIETGLDRKIDVEISNNLYSQTTEYSVHIYDAGNNIHFVLKPRASKIEAVYAAVVEFIRWYNTQPS